ncbi:MAG: aminotransferase class IV [Planctomycetaceae bacterium]|nr:aminotransferase class IV [Planctomycetaceae bacterium]
MEKVFLNGQLIAATKAAVPVTDSSYLYGIGLFETMRAVDGRIFRLDDHLSRLNTSAEALGIYNHYSDQQITAAIQQTLEANKLSDARLRLQLSNGPVQPDGTALSTLLITAAEFTPYPPEYYDKGVRLALTDYRQNPRDPYCGHKTTCYGPRLTALKEAHQKLAAEALWFTTENYLAEGCVSNIFLVKDGSLFTPPVQTPVLAGIARKTVLELAEAAGIQCHEMPLRIDDLLSAQEVFLTNVIMEILPVTSIEAHAVGDGKPGKLTQKIAELFKRQLNQ